MQIKFNDSANVEIINQRLLKAFVKCLEDYQGEIKHTKMIIKEVKLIIIYHKARNLKQFKLSLVSIQ